MVQGEDDGRGQNKPESDSRKGSSSKSATKKAATKKTAKAELAKESVKAKSPQKSTQKSIEKKSSKKPLTKKATKKSAAKPKKQVKLRDIKISDAERAEYDEQWKLVRSRLRAILGDSVVLHWYRDFRAAYLRGGQLVVEVPSQYIRDYIETHHRRQLLEHWRAENPKVKRIAFAVRATATKKVEKPKTKIQPVRAAVRLGGDMERLVKKEKARPAFEGAGAPLDRSLTFDNFIIGASNQMAYAAAKQLADIETDNTDNTDNKKSTPTNRQQTRQQTKQRMNPLYLYGGVGLGKTHLMHAIAWQILEAKPDCKILYLPAERFMYQFIRALRHHDTIAFKQQFRELDVLMIDDIQFIAEKKATQEEFFHNFNALLGQNAQVVISADRPPQDINGIDERLSSRLGGGMVADIRPTDYELRLDILSAKAPKLMARAGAGVYDYLPTSVTHSLAATHYNPNPKSGAPRSTEEAEEKASADKAVPREVLEFLASKITHNVRELEGALLRVSAYASFTAKSIDLNMTKDVLRDLLRAAERRITIDEIQRQVADYYNIGINDMVSDRRYRTVARPRQIAMYLAKELTPRSYPQIGKKFGGRDHSTVIHAVRRIANLREIDADLDQDVETILSVLK